MQPPFPHRTLARFRVSQYQRWQLVLAAAMPGFGPMLASAAVNPFGFLKPAQCRPSA